VGFSASTQKLHFATLIELAKYHDHRRRPRPPRHHTAIHRDHPVVLQSELEKVREDDADLPETESTAEHANREVPNRTEMLRVAGAQRQPCSAAVAATRRRRPQAVRKGVLFDVHRRR